MHPTTKLFAALPRRARSEVEHATQNLASLLTAAGYLDVRSRVDGYPSPRLHPEVLDLPDVTAVNLHGVHEVFYVLSEAQIEGSLLTRPWRTLLAGCGPDLRVWLAVPESYRAHVETRLVGLGVRAWVLAI